MNIKDSNKPVLLPVSNKLDVLSIKRINLVITFLKNRLDLNKNSPNNIAKHAEYKWASEVLKLFEKGKETLMLPVR